MKKLMSVMMASAMLLLASSAFAQRPSAAGPSKSASTVVTPSTEVSSPEVARGDKGFAEKHPAVAKKIRANKDQIKQSGATADDVKNHVKKVVKQKRFQNFAEQHPKAARAAMHNPQKFRAAMHKGK